MADNNRQNERKNVTGSYPGVTGSYKPTSAYPKSATNPMARSEQVKKEGESTHPAPQKEKFDFKLWFSKDNVRGFLKQLRFYGIILLVSILLTWGIVAMANDVFAFVKPDESIIVTIEENASVSKIAKALDKAGVIEHETIFKLYCKLKKSSGFKFGDYTLNSNMGYDQIISALKKTSVQAETVTVTIAPGATQDEIVEYLTSNKYATATDLEQALNEYEYKDFDFVKDLPDRRCRLEGYLPAGDYEINKGENAVSIVEKMLARFEEQVLTEENRAKIKEKKLSLDEIVTFASLIEAECDSADMYKGAAAVIYNRLATETDNFLELTSSINYVLPSPKTTFSSDDKKTESTYNTYLYSGLPTGPVCTPTVDAINAVLSPETNDYFYFISDGEKSYFAKTAEEHTDNLKKASTTCKGTTTIK